MLTRVENLLADVNRIKCRKQNAVERERDFALVFQH